MWLLFLHSPYTLSISLSNCVVTQLYRFGSTFLSWCTTVKLFIMTNSGSLTLLFLLKHLLMNDFRVATGWRYCIREGGGGGRTHQCQKLISGFAQLFPQQIIHLNIFFFCVNTQVLHCWDNHCIFCLTDKNHSSLSYFLSFVLSCAVILKKRGSHDKTGSHHIFTNSALFFLTLIL